MGRDIAAECTA